MEELPTLSILFGVPGPGARGSALPALNTCRGGVPQFTGGGAFPPSPALPFTLFLFGALAAAPRARPELRLGSGRPGGGGPRQRGGGGGGERGAEGAMRRGAVLAGALAAYAVYLVLGALLVARLERPHEARLRAELETLREELLRRSPCVAAPALDAFVERVLAAGRLGRAALANASGPANASDPAWDFASALFFASTLVTTVGTCHRETPLSRRTAPSPLWD